MCQGRLGLYSARTHLHVIVVLLPRRPDNPGARSGWRCGPGGGAAGADHGGARHCCGARAGQDGGAEAGEFKQPSVLLAVCTISARKQGMCCCCLACCRTCASAAIGCNTRWQAGRSTALPSLSAPPSVPLVAGGSRRVHRLGPSQAGAAEEPAAPVGLARSAGMFHPCMVWLQEGERLHSHSWLGLA